MSPPKNKGSQSVRASETDFPLVVSLRQKLESGELISGQSSTWDWLESLTKEDEKRLTRLVNSELSNDVGEVIVLAVRLLVMETGVNRGLTEEEIESLVQMLALMSATRELIKSGLVEVRNFPKRLADRDQKFEIRLTGRDEL